MRLSKSVDTGRTFHFFFLIIDLKCPEVKLLYTSTYNPNLPYQGIKVAGTESHQVT